MCLVAGIWAAHRHMQHSGKCYEHTASAARTPNSARSMQAALRQVMAIAQQHDSRHQRSHSVHILRRHVATRRPAAHGLLHSAPVRLPAQTLHLNFAACLARVTAAERLLMHSLRLGQSSIARARHRDSPEAADLSKSAPAMHTLHSGSVMKAAFRRYVLVTWSILTLANLQVNWRVSRPHLGDLSMLTHAPQWTADSRPHLDVLREQERAHRVERVEQPLQALQGGWQRQLCKRCRHLAANSKDFTCLPCLDHHI